MKVISNRNVTSSVSARGREGDRKRESRSISHRTVHVRRHTHIIGSVSSVIISIYDILETVYKSVVVGAIRFFVVDANLCQRRKQT